MVAAVRTWHAVPTRLPAPHRPAPPDAWSLVKANFIDHATCCGSGRCGLGHAFAPGAAIQTLRASVGNFKPSDIRISAAVAEDASGASWRTVQLKK